MLSLTPKQRAGNLSESGWLAVRQRLEELEKSCLNDRFPLAIEPCRVVG
jgi:hypothetical protein